MPQSGGYLIDKTPTEIYDLIKNMAEDLKHTRQDEYYCTDAPRGVKEVNTPQIEAQLSEYALKSGIHLTHALNCKKKNMKKQMI